MASSPQVMPLQDFPVHHAGRLTVTHPELQCDILAQTAVRYLRFLRPVRVDYMLLPILAENSFSGRWVPKVPTHPAHINVSVLDKTANCWVKVADIDVPQNPKCTGAGLSQDMSIEQMEAYFHEAVAGQTPLRLDLDGIETDCLKVECDREHPVWPNHGECNGGPFNVPFGILQHLSAFGEDLGTTSAPLYRRKLVRGQCNPAAPKGMTLDTRNPLEVVFRSNRLAVGFSLIRPMLTRLGWNHFGDRPPEGNRLLFKGSYDGSNTLGGLNGPSFITLAGDFVPQNMSGTVDLSGNQVHYQGIETGCGVVIDALFTVTAEALTVELRQQADTDLPVIEGESWRLLWDMRAGLTGVAARPHEKEGRNGFVQFPALVTADSGGCLAVRLLAGDGSFHTESYRQQAIRSTGFVLAEPDTAGAPLVIPRGSRHAVFELRPSALLPVPDEKETVLTDGVRHCWTAGFSAFRPEFGGFSNNAVSTNCHVNQHAAFDFAAFTARPEIGPDPLELVKFSIGRALLDGGGYGYHRSLYLDSDPILLSGAGRIMQLAEDRDWLEQVGPGIRSAAGRIIANFDANEGLIVCRTLSGNSGSYRWSSNAMDVIGFGHLDAYVNAWSFRGMKNAAALCTLLGDRKLAASCTATADAIYANYTHRLVNPETGRVSGWCSRDGQLHDYAFMWINGIACAFGVVDTETARCALENLEMMRHEVFPESGYPGVPLNLLPIAKEDHMLPRISYRTKPTYENYTDGALSPVFLNYYLRALARNGLRERASVLANELERGFADGMFHGPFGTGKEFMVWTGADSGYEGTFGPNSTPLYAIAVERGVITPPEPEWWLAESE